MLEDLTKEERKMLRILRKRENVIKNKPIKRKQDKEYRNKHPKKEKCKQRTRYLIRIGKIKRKPCIHCGNKEAEAHHQNYNDPYNIIWVCHKCHINFYHT